MLVNKYISDVLKTKLEEAIKSVKNLPSNTEDVCSRYQCTMVFQPKKEQPKNEQTKRYFIRTFDNRVTDNEKGYKGYLNNTRSRKPKSQRKHDTKTKAYQVKEDKQTTQRNPNTESNSQEATKEENPRVQRARNMGRGTLQYVPSDSKTHGKHKNKSKEDYKNYSLDEHHYEPIPQEETKQEWSYIHNTGDTNMEDGPDSFGSDPRFPPFPTFPSFPSFPEFPESPRN